MLLCELKMRFFFIFIRAKRQEIKLIQRPKNLLVIVICWLLTKKIISRFYLQFYYSNQTQMKCREAIDSQNRSGYDPREDNSKPGQCGHTGVYPRGLSTL